jgi:hypothetical protein
MAQVALHELESAINWWRAKAPPSDGACALSPQVAALAKPYALLIWQRAGSIRSEQLSDAALDALQLWRATQSNSSFGSTSF